VFRKPTGDSWRALPSPGSYDPSGGVPRPSSAHLGVRSRMCRLAIRPAISWAVEAVDLNSPLKPPCDIHPTPSGDIDRRGVVDKIALLLGRAPLRLTMSRTGVCLVLSQRRTRGGGRLPWVVTPSSRGRSPPFVRSTSVLLLGARAPRWIGEGSNRTRSQSQPIL